MTNPACVLLAAVLLAGCGSDAGREAERAASGSAAAPDSAPAPAPPAAQPSAPAVVLARDGLDLAGGAGRLAFGGPRAGAMAAVQAALGPPRQQGAADECPSGPLYQAQFAGIQLVFRDSAFVGWFAEEGAAFRTARGVGPGSTVAQLKAAYPTTTVDATSLGMEFVADDLYGVVTDSTDTGRVQVMFAGVSCIFR